MSCCQVGTFCLRLHLVLTSANGAQRINPDTHISKQEWDCLYITRRSRTKRPFQQLYLFKCPTNVKDCCASSCVYVFNMSNDI
ncbi:hypothetical protein EDB19DRAFT_79594 [Suillus lakei]|nr:hypothetical protein EDB19DRAFT_79594 [Suillus lakei]